MALVVIIILALQRVFLLQLEPLVVMLLDRDLVALGIIGRLNLKVNPSTLLYYPFLILCVVPTLDPNVCIINKGENQRKHAVQFFARHCNHLYEHFNILAELDTVDW